MGRISRRAADELKRTVQIVRGLAPKGAGFADPGLPIRLAKTTAAHAIGATQDVTLLWGDKGDETDGTTRQDTVPAFNRFVQLDAGQEVQIARIGVGWEILGTGGSADPSFCGVCSTISTEGLVIDLGGALLAANQYIFTGRCGGEGWLFTFDADDTWTGESEDDSAPCTGGDPLALTATLVVTSAAPGGVVVTFWNGMSAVAQWVNETAWQPCVSVRMTLATFDPTCVCVAWLQATCLVPVPVA